MIVTFIIIFPFYWAFITSIKLPKEAFSLSLIPWLQFKPTLMNWKAEVVGKGETLFNAIKNSLIVATSSALISTLIGTLAGYGLARFRYQTWKNKDIAIFFLASRMVPPVVVVLPYFLIFKFLGLIDTKISLIVVYTAINMVFPVLLSRDAFHEIPSEIEECALVDGCTRFGVFFRVSLPLVIPAVVAAFIICYAFAWNEFLIALTLTFRHSVTIPITIAGTEHIQGVQFWFTSIRFLLTVAPPVVVAAFAQKFIVKGLTFGAVKG